MRAFRARLVVFVIAFCLALGTLARMSSVGGQAPVSQQPSQAQQRPQQPTFRAGVNAVRVDVVVTDRQGEPVADLTAADFEVYEDGKPQAIDSCKLVRVQTQQEPGGEAPRAIRSFEDEATELARDDVRIIVMLLDDYHVSRVSAFNLRGWLRRFITTQVGAYDLIALMYPMTPTSALTFTRDRFALTSVIDKFEGRRGDYMPRNQIEANYSMLPPGRVEQVRGEVVASAIKSVCYHLGALNEGRKSLIVVAESLPVPTSDLSELIEAANRNNVAVYTLDPGGLTAFGASDVLRALADETNGRAITERNDLESGLAVVLRDSSAYYLLGYNSNKSADGRFHEIKVRLKRAGVQVRARKGYWAPTAAEAARVFEPPKPGAPPALTAALSALSQPRDRLVRTWIGASRGENGRTRLTFVWEPDAPATSAGQVARVKVVASDAEDRSYVLGPVPLGWAAKPPATQASVTGRVLPMAARGALEVPPGRLHAHISMEDGEGAVVDSEVRDIDVPDFREGRLAMSTPSVFHARTAKELRAIRSDPEAAPAAGRQFVRGEQLLVRFDLYHPGGMPATPTARLLTRFGREMAKLPVASDPVRPDGRTIDVPLAGLVGGEYVIEIRASGAGQEATALVPIRVTS